MSTQPTDYIYSLGRRKTASARVRFYNAVPPEGVLVSVNGKPLTQYFPEQQANTVIQPIDLISQDLGGYFTVKVVGGGVQSQADAIAHGIARLLVRLNPDWKKLLKSKGLTTRDPRMKERKKPGLRRARRSPQWSKR